MATTAMNAYGLPPTFSTFNNEQMNTNFKPGHHHIRTDVTSGQHGISATGPHHEAVNLQKNPHDVALAANGLPSTMGMLNNEQLQSPANYHRKRSIHEPHPVTNIPRPPSANVAPPKQQTAARANVVARPQSSSRWKATSISSSEFVGRVDALQLQFEEERKRRQKVEKRIINIATNENEPVAAPSAILTQNSLLTADRKGRTADGCLDGGSEHNLREYLKSYTPPPSMPRGKTAAVAYNGPRSARVPSAPGRRATHKGMPMGSDLEAAVNKIVPKIDGNVAKRAENAGRQPFQPVWLRPGGADRHRLLGKQGPDVRKPSLPCVARGVKSGLPGAAKCVKTHSRKRVDGIEVYTAEKRHDHRMHQLAAFEAQMLGFA